jgi:hypothetical protein
MQSRVSSMVLESLSLSPSPPNPKPTSLDRRGEEEAFFAPLPALIPCPVYSCPLEPLTGSGPRPARPPLCWTWSDWPAVLQIPGSSLHESRNSCLWGWNQPLLVELGCMLSIIQLHLHTQGCTFLKKIGFTSS